MTLLEQAMVYRFLTESLMTTKLEVALFLDTQRKKHTEIFWRYVFHTVY